MATKLHRCVNRAKFGPCWRVQKALDDEGIPYEVVRGPWRPKNRTRVIEGTGQALYPAIQFEDGSWYREESKEMARTISEGLLMEKRQRRHAAATSRRSGGSAPSHRSPSDPSPGSTSATGSH